MVDKRELETIESYISQIQDNKNVDVNLKAIERTLERCFDSKFHLTIIPSKSFTSEFFGMNIYPDTSTIDMIVKKIMNDDVKEKDVQEVWKECKEWFIEIDYKLLYNSQLATNPKEIVAVLLHEIGHTIYANTIVHRLYKVIRFKIIKSNYNLRKLCKNPKFYSLFNLAVLGACESKNFSYIDEKKEIDADRFVVKCGYGVHLDSFITKLIMVTGNANVSRTEHDEENDVAIMAEWSLNNISLLELRRNKLRKDLSTRSSIEKSPFVKKILLRIRDRIFGSKDVHTMEAMTAEYNTMQLYNSIISESFRDFVSGVGKLKKVKQSDLDVIRIEIDRIETLDDKYYVLDLIYDKLNVVNLGLEYYATGNGDRCSQSKDTLNVFRTTLEKYRETVLNMRIIDKQYGLFIKVPKGYEG